MIYGLVFCAIIIGSAALIIACIGLSLVVGLKNSTHQVQYVSNEELQPLKKMAAEFNKIEEEIEDNLL